MWFRSALNSLTSRNPGAPRGQKRRGPARRRPTYRHIQLEPLEDRRLLSLTTPVNYAIGGGPYAVTAADFNNDGVQDLAVVNSSFTGTVSVLLGNPDGTFQPARNSATGDYPRSLAVGDFNADGKLDLATANASNISVLLSNGDGTFGAPANYIGDLGTSPQSVAVGDFNADGKLDLGVTSNLYVIDGYWCYYGCVPYGHYEGRAHVLLGHGDGTLAPPSTTELGPGYHKGAAAMDFNGDGRDDFATVNADYAKLRVLPANTDNSGNFLGPTDYATGWSPQSVVLGDVNGDGINDVITSDSSGVSVLLGNGAAGVGDGTFQPAQITSLGFNPTSLAVGDFNADHKLDLVATSVYVIDGYNCGYYGCGPYGHYEGRVNVLLGHGNGTFTTPQISAVEGTHLPGVAAGDFNGDGFADVAVALPPTSPNGYTSSVSVLLNTQDWRSFSISAMSPTTAGDAQTITVTALDTDFSVLSGYTGTVHFTSSDAQAALPADYTFTAGNNGTHTFTVTLKTAGAQSLTVADTTTPDFVGSQGGIMVNAAAASRFVLADLPSTMSSGDYGYFSVTVTDAYGNRASNYSGTVHFTSSDALATLPADYTFTSFDGGMAYFSAALSTVGTQSITATDTANAGVTGTGAGIPVVPRATISGPYYATRNQTLTFTLGASGGLPASTVFSYAIDWNYDGVVDQAVSGPSGTTVDHSYGLTGYYYAVVTATVTVGGENYTSYAAYQSVYVFDVSVTIQTDPGDATKSALVVEGTADAETFVLGPGTGNSVALSYNGYGLGTFTAPDGTAFAHVLVYGNGESDSIQLSGSLAVPAFVFGGDGNDTLDARGSIGS